MKGKNMKGRKIIKRLLTLLCCGMLMLTGVGSNIWYASSVPDDDWNGYARIALLGDTDTPTGKAGENMTVRLHLANQGDLDAEDVTIVPQVSKDENEFPFEISKSTYSVRLGGGNPARTDSVLKAKDDDTVVFNFKVRNDVVTDYYEIKYKITYSTEGSSTLETITVSSYVYIEGKPKDKDTEKLDIQISLQNSPALPPVTYGQPVAFDLFLTNYGKTDAKSVTITPEISESADKFPFEVELTSYEQRMENPLLGTVSQPSESDRNQRVHFNWKARTDIKTGYYPVTFKITAKDENGTDYSVDQTVFFNIAGNPAKDKEDEEATEKEKNKSEPRLIVTGYETDKKEIKAGDEFELTIHIMNTSDRTAVSNIKFTLSSSEDKNDNCFIPMSGSSTMFVKRIGMGESIDLVVDMTAKPTLEAKSYPLTIESEYEDSDVTQYKGLERISIPVTQELRVTTGNIEVEPSSIEVGRQSNIMFPVNNLGKSKIYNVSIEFEGDSISGGETYKGNLDSGATANVDAMVTGIAPTMDEGYVTALISYENEKGEIFTERKEFQLYVTEPYIPDDSMDFPVIDGTMMNNPGAQKGLKPWMIYAGAGVLATIVAAVVAVILIKRKKRKKMEEEVEEDEIL